MCGISGILDFSGQKVDQGKIEKMNASIAHRGPDGSGVWLSEDSQVGFGHRRLSIIDLSERGKQPMHSANGQYSITYNGEIYNYLELREDLKRKGYIFKTETDTEVILNMYTEYGEECLQHFDGMFAFALWDEERKRLFCARDRFGEKPFFYTRHSGQFIFASELKALWTAGVPKEVGEEAIFRYLMYGVTNPGEQSGDCFYKAVYKIPPAHFLIIESGGETHLRKYWDLTIAIDPKFQLEESVSTFYELLNDSVKKRMRSDVQIGTSLSGGLDSSSIVYLMNNELQKQGQVVNTFTIRYPGFEKDEGEFVDQIESDIAIKRKDVFPTENEISSEFELVQNLQDEPFGSFSISSQNQIYKAASESGVKVLLDGQGADEILGGYSTNRMLYYKQLKKTNYKRYNNELKAYKEMYGVAFEDGRKTIKALDFLPTSHSTFRKGIQKLRKNDASYFLGISPEIVSKYKLIENPLTPTQGFRESLLYSIQQKGLVELLRYADRNAMHHSVEVRLPFLSHQLVEFVFSLPDEFLINQAWTKFVLRKSMSQLLPESISWRKKKIGFAAPEKKLFSTPHFKSLINDSSALLKSMGIISKPHEILEWRYVMLAHYLK